MDGSLLLEIILDSSDLKGLSGCKISLCTKNDGGRFVRKVSSSFDYNARLRAQCDKQIQFQQSNIHTPPVLDCGVLKSGLYYFDMKYIHGQSLAHKLRTTEGPELRFLANGILDILKAEQKIKLHYSMNPIEAFEDKINSLENGLEDCSLIRSALAKVKNIDFHRVEESTCHGDLTCENILVGDDGVLYVIDTLDSFYNSWQLDIAKLFFDIDTLWSWRATESNDNLRLKLSILRKMISEYLDSEDLVLCNNLEIFQLLRILPYAKTDLKTYKFLCSSLNNLLIR